MSKLRYMGYYLQAVIIKWYRDVNPVFLIKYVHRIVRVQSPYMALKIDNHYSFDTFIVAL